LQEAVSIQLKDKTIVLLRLKVEKDGEPLNLLENHGGLGASWDAINWFRLNLANIDEEEFSIQSIYNSPSLEARGEGWIYQVLKPGTYYLAFSPPGNNVPNEIYSYRFHVSQGDSILYIGSLSVSCMGKQKFYDPWISNCSEVNVIDERESAQKIAQTSFSQYGTLSTSIMQQYDKLVTSFAIDESVPMGVMIKDTDIFTTPDLMKRAIGQGGALGAELGQQAFLFTVPLGLAVGAIKGVADKGIYQQCMQELEQEVRKLDRAEILRQTLNKTLPKYSISQLVGLDGDDNICESIAKNGLKSVLQAEILRIVLIEDSTWGKKFYVEVAIRIQLKNVTTNTCLYDRVLLYTNPDRIISYDYKTYELPLCETSESRKLEVYCEQEGHKILKDEITKAIQFSVERFCQDLGLEPYYLKGGKIK
jgi:hypothetical protein